jgi:hypothetical protein
MSALRTLGLLAAGAVVLVASGFFSPRWLQFRASPWEAQGDRLANAGDPAGAVAAWREAVRRNPESPARARLRMLAVADGPALRWRNRAQTRIDRVGLTGMARVQDPPVARSFAAGIGSTRSVVLSLAAPLASLAPAAGLMSAPSPAIAPPLAQTPAPPIASPTPPPTPAATALARWSLATSWVWQEGAPASAGLPGQAIGGGYAGAELAYRLADLGPGGLRASAGLFTGLGDSTPLPKARTAQASLGLRWSPSMRVPAWIGVERLIDVGGEGRDAWMVRAAASVGTGYDPPIGERRWWQAHAYADTALVGARSRDVFALAEGRLGHGWQLDDSLSVSAYGAARLTHDGGADATLADAGPGVALRWRGPAGVIETRLEYRLAITGEGGGLRLGLHSSF